MAEELDPAEEGRRIASRYLSQHGWTGEWRRSLNTQLYPAFDREEFEEKQRNCDRMEEEAEEIFSSEVESLRHAGSARSKEVLKTIYQIMGHRIDLGFFAKRIMEHLKRELFHL